jgi:hypothetical protein
LRNKPKKNCEDLFLKNQISFQIAGFKSIPPHGSKILGYFSPG